LVLEYLFQPCVQFLSPAVRVFPDFKQLKMHRLLDQLICLSSAESFFVYTIISLSDVSSNVGSLSVVLSVVKRTVERDLADLQKKGVLIRDGDKFIPTSNISLILQQSHPNPVR